MNARCDAEESAWIRSTLPKQSPAIRFQNVQHLVTVVPPDETGGIESSA